jgi:hypothetical protein
MKPLSSALSFTAGSVLIATLLGFLSSGLTRWAAWVAITFGIVAAVVAWRTTKSQRPTKFGFWDWGVLAIFSLASLRAFLWILYPRGDELSVLSPNNLGDMALHLNLIRYLASGVAFWPESSILSNVPLSYPLGMDLLNTLLELCGVDTIRGLIWTGLAGAVVTGYALWLWGGAFGVAAFLFNGGLAGFAVLRTLQIDDFQRDMIWKNLFLSMFVTQRGLLFALPAGLLLLTAWRDRYFRGGNREIPFGIQLLLYAIMPLFNLHAFLFLSSVLLAIFISLFSDPKARGTNPLPSLSDVKGIGLRLRLGDLFRNRLNLEVLALVAAAALPATAGIFLVTGFFSVSSGIRWSPFWIMEGGGWNLWVWIWDFGLALPLSASLAVALVAQRDREARCFVWLGSIMFTACCLFVFAPWEWDNMKLMLWSWLVIAPYLWEKLIAPLKLAARAAVCIVLFFSGGVSLIGGLDTRHGYTIAQRSELDAWRHAVSSIRPQVRFASVSDYNHPLILLGRKVACGYEGHLWSHGLAYREKIALLKNSLSGEVSWRFSAPLLGVGWLALRKEDVSAAKPPGDSAPGHALGALYDLEPLLREDPASPKPPQLQPRSVDLVW